jgi:hypothetical protein
MSWIQPLLASFLSSSHVIPLRPSLQLFSYTYLSLSTSLLSARIAKEGIYALARSPNCFALNPHISNNSSSLGRHCSSRPCTTSPVVCIMFLPCVCCDTVCLFHCLCTASMNTALTSTAQCPLINVQH